MSLKLGYNMDEVLESKNIPRTILADLRKASAAYAPASITDEQLLLFYIACKYSVESASQTIKKCYNQKKHALEHFTRRDPESAHIQQCLKNQIYFFLPVTPNGHSVIFHRLANSKPSNYIFDEAIKTYFMTIDSCLYNQGPTKSVIFLFDMKNVNLGHLTRIRISAIKNFFHYVQDCIPIVLHEIHILNTVGFFDKVLALVKPFMKAEILSRLHMHPSTNDYGKLLKDVIPLSCLPSDFGGDLPSVEEMHAAHCQEFMKLRNYFIEEEQQWNDVPTKGKSSMIEETRSSFSKLDID